MNEPLPEAWLRGPVEGVPIPLQPVAHALLQASEEVEALLRGFPHDRLWTRPHGVASVGFHLQHMRGVVDRLFTYADGRPLSAEQRHELAVEGTAAAPGTTPEELVEAFRDQVAAAIAHLRRMDERILADHRPVGRRNLPSTVQGILYHAAEHVQRHLGQLLVTVRVQEQDLRSTRREQ